MAYAGQLAHVVSGNWGASHPDANFYQMSLVSGNTTALSAADPVFSFRTGTGTLKYLITQCRVFITQPTGFTTAKPQPVELYVARSFTASDTGGVAATITGNNGKSRTGDVTTTISDCRIANTGTLTAGTRTLDAVAMGVLAISCSTSNNASILNGNNILTQTHTPLILTANEGIVLVTQQAYAANGTWLWRVGVEWAEVPDW